MFYFLLFCRKLTLGKSQLREAQVPGLLRTLLTHYYWVLFPHHRPKAIIPLLQIKLAFLIPVAWQVYQQNVQTRQSPQNGRQKPRNFVCSLPKTNRKLYQSPNQQHNHFPSTHYRTNLLDLSTQLPRHLLILLILSAVDSPVNKSWSICNPRLNICRSWIL